MKSFTQFAWMVINILAVVCASKATASSLPEEALAIFEKHCKECHGTPGAGEAGFDYVLDLKRLTSGPRPKVIPGKPEASRLFKRVANKEMPPEEKHDPLTSGEIETLRNWIASGAQPIPSATVKANVSEESVLADAERDLSALPEAKRAVTRYLTFFPWEKTAADSVTRVLAAATNKTFNSLSWQPAPAKVRQVGPSLFALDLEDIGWAAFQWEQALEDYPYRTDYPANPSFKKLKDLTREKLPIVRADWLIREVTRPQKYYELLQLPENERALEAMFDTRGARIDFQDDIRKGDVVRLGFNASGVALNKNRILERHELEYRLSRHGKVAGYFWRSYDTKTTTGRGNYFGFPLTIFEDPAFAFSYDGGEMIWSLPNGFQAYYLANNKGNRINDGPIDLVSGTRARPVISNGISCMDCHSQGLILKQDEIREHVLKSAFPESAKTLVSNTYIPVNEMTAQFDKDRAIHAKALQAMGISPTATDPVNALVYAYEADLTPELAAAEIGKSLTELASLLRGSSFENGILGGILTGRNVSRTDWEDEFPKLVDLLSRSH